MNKKGRLLKLKLNHDPINNDLDNFIFNIVLKRPNNNINITKGKLKVNSIDVNDYIFIQVENVITHYMLCKIKGPIFNSLSNKCELSIKNPLKLEVPINKKDFEIFNDTNGQSYSHLTSKHIDFIFEKQPNKKYTWTESDNIICSLSYLQNYSIEKTHSLLSHIPLNSIKMKYKNCLYLDKGEQKGALANFSKQHSEVWNKINANN